MENIKTLLCVLFLSLMGCNPAIETIAQPSDNTIITDCLDSGQTVVDFYRYTLQVASTSPETDLWLRTQMGERISAYEDCSAEAVALRDADPEDPVVQCFDLGQDVADYYYYVVAWANPTSPEAELYLQTQMRIRIDAYEQCRGEIMPVLTNPPN